MRTMGLRPAPLAIALAALTAAPLCGALHAGQSELEAAPVRAEETIDPLAPILDAFASDSFDARERASAKLVEQPHVTDQEIIKALRIQSLTAEQRTRLIDALRTRFTSTPRAGLGISMQAGEGGVGVQRVVPGFPADKVIAGGDIIISLGGVEMRDPTSVNDLRHVILSYDPGDRIPVELVRENRLLTVHAQLGRYEDLGQAQTVSTGDINAAWAFRLERLDIEACPGEALECGLKQRDWVLRLNRNPSRPDAGAMLAGGQPMSEASSMSQRAAGRFVAQARTRAEKEAMAADNADDPALRLQAAMQLDERIKAMEAEIRSKEAKLINGDLTARERTELQAEIRQMRRTLTTFRAGFLQIDPNGDRDR